MLYARLQVRLFLRLAFLDSGLGADVSLDPETSIGADGDSVHLASVEQWVAELASVVTKELDQSGLSSVSILR